MAHRSEIQGLIAVEYEHWHFSNSGTAINSTIWGKYGVDSKLYMFWGENYPELTSYGLLGNWKFK
jgi:hypothetical protein